MKSGQEKVPPSSLEPAGQWRRWRAGSWTPGSCLWTHRSGSSIEARMLVGDGVGIAHSAERTRRSSRFVPSRSALPSTRCCTRCSRGCWSIKPGACEPSTAFAATSAPPAPTRAAHRRFAPNAAKRCPRLNGARTDPRTPAACRSDRGGRCAAHRASHDDSPRGCAKVRESGRQPPLRRVGLRARVALHPPQRDQAIVTGPPPTTSPSPTRRSGPSRATTTLYLTSVRMVPPGERIEVLMVRDIRPPSAT